MLFNSFKRTYLTISLTFTIAKRFGHGDRPMGHASKILQALAKKTPPLSPSSVANTPQDASSNRPHIKEVPPEIPTLPEPPSSPVSDVKPSYKDTLANLGAKMFHSIPTPHQTSGLVSKPPTKPFVAAALNSGNSNSNTTSTTPTSQPTNAAADLIKKPHSVLPINITEIVTPSPSEFSFPTSRVSYPPSMSPKYYNHNNIGGINPVPSYDPSRDSYSINPNVAWAFKQAQNHPPSMNISLNTQESQQTFTETTSQANLSNTTYQPLTPTTGALVVYDPTLQGSVKEVNDLLIINENPYKDQISGIASMSEGDRVKLLNDPEYLCKFAQIFFFEHTKMLHYVFRAPLNNQNMFDILAKCFSLYPLSSILKRDDISYQIYQNKFPSMCQHILTLLFPTKDFGIFEIVSRYGNLIDLSYQKKITILTMIEFHFFCNLLELNNIDKEDFLGHIRSIDPQSPLLDKGDLFKTQECESQIMQKYSDFFIYFLKIGKGVIEVIQIYRDIKMDNKGPLTGHITVKPYLTTDLKLARQYMNNYTTELKKQLKEKNLWENEFFRTKYNKLNKLQNTIDQNTLKENILEFNNTLIQITLSEHFIKQGIHVTVASDLTYNEDNLEEILDKVQNDAQLTELFVKYLDIFYPKSNNIHKISWLEYLDFILEINHRYGLTATKEDIANNIRDHFKELLQQTNDNNE